MIVPGPVCTFCSEIIQTVFYQHVTWKLLLVRSRCSFEELQSIAQREIFEKTVFPSYVETFPFFFHKRKNNGSTNKKSLIMDWQCSLLSTQIHIVTTWCREKSMLVLFLSSLLSMYM